MSTKTIAPRLAESLRLLAASQLQMQTARSAALDGGALGVMAVDAAFATLIVDTVGIHHFWIAALVLLALSLSLAVYALPKTWRWKPLPTTRPSPARTCCSPEL